MRETQADVVTTGKLLEWNEVEEVAAELFTIWGGGDLRWAKVAWTVLSETGLTRYASEVDRTVCIVRLIALNALYREFCVYAFDEGTSGDWEYQVTADLLDDDPFVDAFSLGQFTQQRGFLVDNSRSWDPDARVWVLQELVKAEYPRVVSALREQWGENELFTALYASPSAEYDDLYPVSNDLLDDVLNSDVNGTKLRAHAWYTEGMRL